MFSTWNLLFFMNYSSRLVTKSSMGAPDEFIIVVNTNGKATVWQHFRLKKRPGNFKLDENTAVYLSNLAATSGGTTSLGYILGWYHPTTLSKSQMKNRPPTSTTTTTTRGARYYRYTQDSYRESQDSYRDMLLTVPVHTANSVSIRNMVQLLSF